MFRSHHPKSWWWNAETDFLSAILFTVQTANWQRGGGKGGKPQLIKRPHDPPVSGARRGGPQTAEELNQRRKELREKMKRRASGN